MNASPGSPLAKAARFLDTNGLFVFAGEIRRRCGVLLRRLSLQRKLQCRGLALGPRCHLRGLSYIRLGRNFHAAEGLWLEAINIGATPDNSIRIRIGDNVAVSRWSHIAATHRVEIGDGVLIGSQVIITDHNHGQYSGPYTHPEIPPLDRPLDSSKHVLIGQNVWIGDGVVGHRCGDRNGGYHGANSVVIGQIPPSPSRRVQSAKPIKRFDFTSRESVPHPMKRAACTIVSLNYLPYARVLCNSFLRHHPDCDFYVLLVRIPANLDLSCEPCRVLPVEDLGIPDFLSVAFKYEILELNTNVKPTFLKWLFAQGYDQVVYLDPDIFVYRRLNSIFETLARSTIVITPHCLTPNQRDPASEAVLLKGGVFNLGFVAVRRCEETAHFLDWWEQQRLSMAFFEPSKGISSTRSGSISSPVSLKV